MYLLIWFFDTQIKCFEFEFEFAFAVIKFSS